MSQHTEKVFRQVLGGCTAVVEGLGSLRNKLGDAHGKGRLPVKPAPRHAELAVNLAGAMATFLVAPIFSILGTSIGGAGTSIGFLSTCVLISITAARSYRHERAQLPPGRLWRIGKFPMSNYLAGVATIWVFATAGILYNVAVLVWIIVG